MEAAPEADEADAALEARVQAAIARADGAALWLPCDPALADTAAFCAHYGIEPGDTANTILVASRDEPKQRAACVVLATTRLDVNHRVRALLGVRRVSFAGAEDTVALTGMKVGGVTPFGLPNGLRILVDARVLARETVVIGGGSRRAKFRIDPQALLRIPGAEAVVGLAKEPEGE